MRVNNDARRVVESESKLNCFKEGVELDCLLVVECIGWEMPGTIVWGVVENESRGKSMGGDSSINEEEWGRWRREGEREFIESKGGRRGDMQ